jgi:hypothetical protein
MERDRLEGAGFSNREAIGVARRQHQAPELACSGAVHDVADGLFVNIAKHEIPAAVNDAANDLSICVDSCGFEGMTAPDTGSLRCVHSHSRGTRPRISADDLEERHGV